MSWYYQPTTPIKTDQGIKARSKRGDFVKNWWASRWIEAMEKVMDRGRLTRGRRYARQGQVLTVDVTNSQVQAQVQGSRRTPYKVTIDVKPLSAQQWDQVIDALVERPIFVAQLLSGEIPPEIAEVFNAAGVSLFPERKSDLTARCSCPDPAAVCKHLAAVHYILAERFDADPFLLFALRGKGRDALLTALRQRQGDTDDERTLHESAASYETATPLPDTVDDFWQMGAELADFSTHITRADTPMPALERLGDPEFLDASLQTLLEPAYTAISEKAIQAAFGEAVSAE